MFNSNCYIADKESFCWQFKKSSKLNIWVAETGGNKKMCHVWDEIKFLSYLILQSGFEDCIMKVCGLLHILQNVTLLMFDYQ